MDSGMEELTSDRWTTLVFFFFPLWSVSGWSISTVWLLLCVHEFGCVGYVFVSGQQQGPRGLSVIVRLTKA